VHLKQWVLVENKQFINCNFAGTALRACGASFVSNWGGSPSRGKRATPIAHRVHHVYSTHRWHRFAYPATLPYGPEYGFLAQVPPNAIRMPGYTFVPGVGILGESCDLPTSACDNRYRDVK
jgi:hypothetical protein